MANEFYTTMQTKAFESQLRQLPQSTKTLFPFATDMGNKVGEEAYFNQFGSMTARKGRVRYGKHEKDEGVYKRRRVTPDFAYLATQLDSKDKVESLVDPRSSLAMGVKHALSRQMSQDLMTAAFGTAYTGKTGADAETFSASDIVAVDEGSTATAGMNAGKLVEAVKLIQNQGFDLSDPMNSLTLVMGPAQSADCKLDTKLANFDYLTNRILSGIDIPDGFMGIRNVVVDMACPYANLAKTGIHSVWSDNGLAQDVVANTDIRMAFLMVKSGVGYSMWEDPIVRVDELQEQHYDYQLYSRVQYGITRMYERGGVVGILCDETP